MSVPLLFVIVQGVYSWKFTVKVYTPILRVPFLCSVLQCKYDGSSFELGSLQLIRRVLAGFRFWWQLVFIICCMVLNVAYINRRGLECFNDLSFIPFPPWFFFRYTLEASSRTFNSVFLLFLICFSYRFFVWVKFDLFFFLKFFFIIHPQFSIMMGVFYCGSLF